MGSREGDPLTNSSHSIPTEVAAQPWTSSQAVLGWGASTSCPCVFLYTQAAEPGSSALLSCWVLLNPVLLRLFRKPLSIGIFGGLLLSQKQSTPGWQEGAGCSQPPQGSHDVSPPYSQGRLLGGKEEPQDDEDTAEMSDLPPCGGGSLMHSLGHPPSQGTPQPWPYSWCL